MKLTITFDLDNAFYAAEPESDHRRDALRVGETLDKVTREVKGRLMLHQGDGSSIFDQFGNRVGSWVVSP